MKNTKLIVLALLVALLACLALSANAECGHPRASWTELDRRDATCTNEGSITWQCKDCGTIWYENIPSLGGHIRSGYYVEANAGTRKACEAKLMVEVCGRHTALGGKCTHVFTDNQYTTTAGIAPHTWSTISEALAATCTTNGHKALTKCSVCGAVKPGEDGSTVNALGHTYATGVWVQWKAATCASEGIARMYCTRCGGAPQAQATPKATYHTDGAGNYVAAPYTVEVLPAKPATCTEPGCKALKKCPTCLAIDPLNDGSAIPALGHHMVVDTTMTLLPTCTTKGRSVLYCDRVITWGADKVPCQHTQLVESPALGHSATWTPVASEKGGTTYSLICGKCGKTLASQFVMPGEKAPSGTVNTGATADTKSYKAATTGTTKVAKTTTTKKTTAKKTTTASTAVKPAAKAAAPAAATTALKNGIIVLNDTVALMAKDGKVTLLNAPAADESVAFYATADAEPVALVVGEAIDFADGAAVAIVKTADLPVATASK